MTQRSRSQPLDTPVPSSTSQPRSVPQKRGRTGLEKCLLTVLLILTIGLLCFLSFLLFQSTNGPERIKTTIPKLGEFSQLTESKAKFLAQNKGLYGYNGRIDHIAATQLPHMKDQTYADYAGSGVYQKRQIEAVMKNLESNLYGNAHSINPSAKNSDHTIQEARNAVLKWFNADPKEYTVIFTPGTTGAIKIVGETFPWSTESTFLYTRSNHNSVLGVREYALDKGATFECIDLDSLKSEFDVRSSQGLPKSGGTDETNHLFAFPAECNYSGEKYPLDLIEKFKNGSLGMKKGKYYVLLDAAAFVPTSKLDLSKYKPDFVTISFYKMFGYPSGLGALIAKNSAANILHKSFFSGGTVSLSIADDDFIQWMPEMCSRFEDGTLPFLNIAALKYGFDALLSTQSDEWPTNGGDPSWEDVKKTMDGITAHTFALQDYFYRELSSATHENGKPMAEFYGHHDRHNIREQGPILNFNMLDASGKYFGFFEISALAAKKGLNIRTGCSCNPGACYDYLNVPTTLIKDTVAHIHHNSCGERLDIVSGHPIGSIRVSLGYLTTFEDVEKLKTFFIDTLRNKTDQQFLDEQQLQTRMGDDPL
ncbi:Molybdenum cofactor sulfurase [Blattamonas nauphoetae]|uniref:Molybdenum cofactor sulfurase n=1 Tax=Blattamonas nauphoetae TaxID=2049346 RepID=A0ABQ9YC61_9EUKA|nr:Molybdenum cofactor sulfurase [Blattamonas nauphoetae]